MTTGVGPRFDAVVSRPPATDGVGMDHVLFVEIGMGADQHGQDATKAAVRACRNAIEFNSIPSIRQIVPGGYDNMKLHIQIGVPKGAELDMDKIRRVFPYGQICEPIEIVEGGLLARSRHKDTRDGRQNRRVCHRGGRHHHRILDVRCWTSVGFPRFCMHVPQYPVTISSFQF